jgi:16S rRNA processing protein RimM
MGRAMTRDTDVLIGIFGAPHGVRGDLRLKSFTADPQSVGDYGPVRATDGTVYRLNVLRPLKDDLVIVRVDGIADRDAAARLTNIKLYVSRSALPAADEDEFYQTDLVGLTVIARADGALLGHIKAVVDFGAGDLLEITRAEGGEPVLLPFTRAFVPEIDIAAGRVWVEPPLGLFAPLPDDDDPQDGR